MEENNEGNKKEEYILKQIVENAIFIAQVLYLGYQLWFWFDNTTTYSVFALNILNVDKMN